MSNDDLLPVAIARLISDLSDYRDLLNQELEQREAQLDVDEGELGTKLIRLGLVLHERANRVE